MYEYQMRMNPKKARRILEDKVLFMNYFCSFIKRKYVTIEKLKSDNQLAYQILSNHSGRLVLKNSRGQAGAEVEVVSCSDYTPVKLTDYMIEKRYDLAEEYVVQHPLLMELSPSGLNTIRVFTQLHDGGVDILGVRLRISVNSPVDNMAAGNLAAAVDPVKGIVHGPGVYSDITKGENIVHPLTGETIIGFAIPYWKEVIDLARRAAMLTPDNKSVGWDIAVTADGPELIEGNHNWCKLLWQLPVKQGLKHELEKYLVKE